MEYLAFNDSHFAIGAIKLQFKASAVVQKEQRTCSFCSLMHRAETEFMTYAVFGAHKFRSPAM